MGSNGAYMAVVIVDAPMYEALSFEECISSEAPHNSQAWWHGFDWADEVFLEGCDANRGPSVHKDILDVTIDSGSK